MPRGRKQIFTKEELRIKKNAYHKEWVNRNKEKIAAQRKKIYFANVERARKVGRDWYHKNRDKALASERAYKQKNYDKVLAYSRRTSAAKGKRDRAELKDHYIVQAISVSTGRPTEEIKGDKKLIAQYRKKITTKRIADVLLKIGFKVCKECNELKPVSAFGNRTHSLNSRCKPCYGQYRKKYKK